MRKLLFLGMMLGLSVNAVALTTQDSVPSHKNKKHPSNKEKQYETIQKLGPQHSLMLDQANKTARYILAKIEKLHKEIDHQLAKYPKNKDLIWAKKQTIIFDRYFNQEGLPWMAKMIERLYLSGQQHNMRRQLKDRKLIIDFSKDCDGFLKPMEDIVRAHSF
jgi:hypothetical protein